MRLRTLRSWDEPRIGRFGPLGDYNLMGVFESTVFVVAVVAGLVLSRQELS